MIFFHAGGRSVQTKTSVRACGVMSANYLARSSPIVEAMDGWIPKSISHLSLSVSVVE